MKDHELSLRRSLAPRSHEGHPQTVAIFQALARGFGVDVSDEHLRHWKSLLTVGRNLDSYIDTQKPDDIMNDRDRLLEGVPAFDLSEAEAVEFSSVIRDVTPVHHDEIIAGFLINDYAKSMREKRGFSGFHQVRTEEAEVFGCVMRLDNPNDDQAIARFNEWLPRFARAGYLIDSFGDLGVDYRDGVIRMQPTLARRIKIGKAALSETADAVRELPLRSIGFLAVASVSKILRNGLKKK